MATTTTSTSTDETRAAVGDVHNRYDAAVKRVESLERELAGIPDGIRRAALAGEHPIDLVTRQAVLPTLIEQAQQQLAPLAVEHYAAELAECDRQRAAVHARWEKADEAVKAAEAKRGELRQALAVADDTRRDLFIAHRQAMRHAAALAPREEPIADGEAG